MEYGRGFDKVWVYGGLRVRDGQELTLTAPSRNTAGWKRLLQAIERAGGAVAAGSRSVDRCTDSPTSIGS